MLWLQKNLNKLMGFVSLAIIGFVSSEAMRFYKLPTSENDYFLIKYTFLLFLATSLLALVTIWLFSATFNLYRAALHESEENKKSMKLALQQYLHMQESSKKQLMPYIGVEAIVLDCVGNEIFTTVKVKNFGATPTENYTLRLYTGIINTTSDGASKVEVKVKDIVREVSGVNMCPGQVVQVKTIIEYEVIAQVFLMTDSQHLVSRLEINYGSGFEGDVSLFNEFRSYGEVFQDKEYILTDSDIQKGSSL